MFTYHYLKYIVVTYLAFMGLFAFLDIEHFPSMFHSVFQISSALFVCFFAYYLLREDLSEQMFMFGLLLYLLILISSCRLFNYFYLGDWLGVGIDGRLYTKIARGFVDGNYNLIDIFEYFKLKKIMVDDYGMMLITSFCFWCFGNSLGFQILPFLSIIPILIGGLFLSRLSDRLTFDGIYSRTLCFVWCTMIYSAYNCSLALKESFMVCFVILAIYFLFQCTQNMSLKNIVLFFFFSSMMFLFRIALFYMLILSWLVAVLLKMEIIRKYINLWMALGLLLFFLFFSVGVNYIGGIRGDVSMDFINGVYQRRMVNGGVFAPILNILATLIGPIPNFVNDSFKVKYMTLFSLTPTLKVFLSFGYIYAIYDIVKNKVLELYPILFFVLLHSIMIWIMFYSLHDRYQWPQYPIVLLLAAYGFKKYLVSSTNNRLLVMYNCVAIICIVFFNLRFV